MKLYGVMINLNGRGPELDTEYMYFARDPADAALQWVTQAMSDIEFDFQAIFEASGPADTFFVRCYEPEKREYGPVAWHELTQTLIPFSELDLQIKERLNRKDDPAPLPSP